MAHRQIDVDIIDEDNYVEDEELDQLQAQRTPAEVEAEVAQRATQVRSLLSRGDSSGALSAALESPYYAKSHETAKERTVQTVVELLQGIKSADIPSAVKGLSIEQQDILMKFLYRGMASPEQFNSGVLLTWHEKLTELTGLGAIVRVLTDRKTV